MKPKAAYVGLTNADRLDEIILNSAKWLTSTELNELSGNKVNSSYPSRCLQEGRLFAIQVDGHELFPRYAVDDSGHPLPVMADILKLFEGKKSSSSIALWFASINGWLGGNSPITSIRIKPNAVLNAVRMEVYPSEHG